MFGADMPPEITYKRAEFECIVSQKVAAFNVFTVVRKPTIPKIICRVG